MSDRASAPSSPEQAALHVHMPISTLMLVLQLAVGDSTAGCCKSSCRLQLCTTASSRDPEEMCSNCATLTTDWCGRCAALLAAPAKATGRRQCKKHPGPSVWACAECERSPVLGVPQQALSLGEHSQKASRSLGGKSWYGVQTMSLSPH